MWDFFCLLTSLISSWGRTSPWQTVLFLRGCSRSIEILVESGSWPHRSIAIARGRVRIDLTYMLARRCSSAFPKRHSDLLQLEHPTYFWRSLDIPTLFCGPANITDDQGHSTQNFASIELGYENIVKWHQTRNRPWRQATDWKKVGFGLYATSRWLERQILFLERRRRSPMACAWHWACVFCISNFQMFCCVHVLTLHGCKMF